MIDACSALKTYLNAQWIETDPAKADLKFALHTIGFDERLEPNKMTPQILLDDTTIETTQKTEYVTHLVQKVTHEVKLTIFLRPVNYQPTTITTALTTFRNMKKEIKKILMIGRYSVSEVNWVDMGEWRDTTKKENEPIIFESSIILRCIYYNFIVVD